MELSQISIGNQKIRLSFNDKGYGPLAASIGGDGCDGVLQLNNPTGIMLKLESKIFSQKDLTFIDMAVDGDKLTARYVGQGFGVEQVITLKESTASMTLTVANNGLESIKLSDVCLLIAETDKGGGSPDNEIDYSKGDPGSFLAIGSGMFDATPIFIDDRFFLGIDWPVAENKLQDNRILCRQFPGVDIEPGKQWTSRSFSVGVAERGELPSVFLKHIDDKRNRPVRRAAFYFDWLTHASEGPTASEVKTQLEFFSMLKDEYGVQFDIYALDDGAVETRWELMFDRYKHLHRTRFPKGLDSLAREARALGMGLGVWIGPDVVNYGDKGEVANRFNDVKAMVKNWEIDLIKLDVCVSFPLKNDPYYNDWYMTKLEELYSECRAINPNLIVINHRIRFSPYMLTILDSTLWDGAESYPEVFLGNGRTPRLLTRQGAYGRRMPSYYGGYSPLLEDHGMCFNGDWTGWRDEFALGAFGRALALSPEIYGTVFMLPDSEYPELGRLMDLARANKELLSHTSYDGEIGSFIHSDGCKAIVCIVNDSWEAVTHRIDAARLGLPGDGCYDVEMLHPVDLYDEGKIEVSAENGLQITIPALRVAVLSFTPSDSAQAWKASAVIQPTDLADTVQLGRAGAAAVDLSSQPEYLGRAVEMCRFAADSDALEYQTLKKLPNSKHAQINECRNFFTKKLKTEITGIAENAWDGDPLTAWGDDHFWKYGNNVWRIDLGQSHLIGAVEFTLSRLFPGPVLKDKDIEGLTGPVIVEISDNLADWTATEAVVYYTRTPASLQYPSAFIAPFTGGAMGRYIRIKARGFYAREIRVRRVDGSLVEPADWKGNNTLTERMPLYHLKAEIEVPELKGYTLATIVSLGDCSVDPNKETVLAWLRMGETVLPLTQSSPILPSHRWEHYWQVPGNNVVFRFDLDDYPNGNPAGRVTVEAVVFEPVFHKGNSVTPTMRILAIPAIP